MKTKIVKVPTAERLPKKLGNYLCVFPDGQIMAVQYDNKFGFFAEFQDCSGITHFLEEIPDREDEMREMLTKIVSGFQEYKRLAQGTDKCDLIIKAEQLLNKQ